MWQQILDALGSARYQQQALCLSSDPLIITLYVVSDLATWISYFVIGISLLMIDKPPSEIRPTMRVLFGSFIFLCGLSHLTMVLTLFSGVYRLDVMVRAAMAGVSTVTAVVVVNDWLLRPRPRR